jgi:hypothetical protein
MTCSTATPAGAYVLALDSLTGTTIGTLPEAGGYSAVDNEGAVYYSVSWLRVGASFFWLSRYDVATGALLARRSFTGNPTGPLTFDSRTGQLYLGVQDQDTSIQIYNGETLADVGRLLAPTRNSYPPIVVIDSDRPAAYVVWKPDDVSLRSRIVLYDTDRFTAAAEADLGNDTRVVGMALGPRPPRAENLTADVTGRVVALAWSNQATRALATGLVIEAGSAPGLSDLARLPIAAGHDELTVLDVPPGAYYVRVRSMNGTGMGDPSNEIAVVVR